MNQTERPEHEILVEEQERDLAEAQAARLEAYLAITPAFLHPAVRRHGVDLFHLVYTSGVASGALRALQDSLNLAISTMAQAPSKRHIAEGVSRQGTQALSVLFQILEVLGQGQITALGLDPEKIPECQRDIELASQLVGSTTNPPGIIISH